MFTALLTHAIQGDASPTFADELGTLHQTREAARQAAKQKWGDRWARTEKYTNPTGIMVVDTDLPNWAYLAETAAQA